MAKGMKMPFEDKMPEEKWKKAGIGLAYVLSPIDLVPEILLGPIGLVDDVVVLIWALYNGFKAVSKRL